MATGAAPPLRILARPEVILFAQTISDCLARLFWPVIILCPLSWAVLASRPEPRDASDLVGSSMGLWLHLPALLLSAAGIAAVLESWPLLSKEQPGSKHLRRLRIGPLQGCGLASIAGIIAMAAGLIVMALCFDLVARSEGKSEAARPIVRALPADADLDIPPALDRRQPARRSLSFSVHSTWESEGLDLRPHALLLERDSYSAMHVQVIGDGKVLNREPILISNSDELISLRFPSRPLRSLEIRALDFGDFRVSFPAGTVCSLSTEQHHSRINCILAALSYLLPAALSLAAICLLGRDCSKAVSLALALTVLVACTLADLTPNAAALQAYGRGEWIPSSGLGEESLLSLALIVTLLLIAIPFRSGVRR